MVKIRVQGLPSEIQTFLQTFREDYDILQESSEYPNRNSQYVRVYIECGEKKKKTTRKRKGETE
ncbi:DUF3970 family protein [Paenibacillus validus]|uniref:DUF3970 family protein n=1 Tax=Paenibacillus validus TaxID=44253 RepID=UPI003D294801